MNENTLKRKWVLEQAIASASPEERIEMVFDFCVAQISKAVGGAGQPWEARRPSVLNCQKGVSLLLESLSDPRREDLEPAVRDLSRSLGSIYEFLLRQLGEADRDRDPGKLQGLEKILRDISGAWRQGVIGRSAA